MAPTGNQTEALTRRLWKRAEYEGKMPSSTMMINIGRCRDWRKYVKDDRQTTRSGQGWLEGR